MNNDVQHGIGGQGELIGFLVLKSGFQLVVSISEWAFFPIDIPVEVNHCVFSEIAGNWPGLHKGAFDVGIGQFQPQSVCQRFKRKLTGIVSAPEFEADNAQH